LFEKIKALSEEKQEIVYALIKVYHMEENRITISNELPYNGKILKNRLKFDLDSLPSKLQYILKLFVYIN
jgi:hypothetical protein